MRYSENLESPIGTLVVVADEATLCGVVFEQNWPKHEARFGPTVQKSSEITSATVRQLSEYFNKARRSFDLPYQLSGTEFEQRALGYLSTIPFGETRTYRDQAVGVSSPKAVRAVGRVNGSNRLCIILPCHRIIGSDGSLTGYAGGTDAKRFLLDLEASSETATSRL